MNVVESLKQTTTKATTQGERYFETSKRFFELKIFQQLTLALSLICKIALIGGLLFLGLIFVLVAATISLGKHLDNTALASLIVALSLIGMGVLIYFFRKQIDRRIIQKVGNEFFDD